MTTHTRLTANGLRGLSSCRGQSLVEFALVLPFLLLVLLGVIEVGHVLFEQHVVTRLTREGSNLISRDVSLQDAVTALKNMSTQPVDFDHGSRLILSVVKRGGTSGTANYDRLILYQRCEYGTLPSQSALRTLGAGSFGGAPDYIAANSDNDTRLQLTNVSNDLVTVKGGMIYITEIYATHSTITPASRFGVTVPGTLYSVAYF
jgi:uncharacterized protein (UPF0333 family)